MSKKPEDLVRDDPATAVSGVAVERVFGRPKAGLSHVLGDKPAYPPWPHSVCLPEGLARGAPPPFDPPLNSAPAAFSIQSEGPPVDRRMFSRRWPITAGRGPSASRLSPRSDRRAAWSAVAPLRRRSPRPPARTLSVPPAGVESLPQPGRKQGRSQRLEHLTFSGARAHACRDGGPARRWLSRMGSLRSRPPAPARHRDPCGCGTTATTPETCVIGDVSHPGAFLVHNDPDVDVQPWIGNGHIHGRSNSACGEADRTPYRMAVDPSLTDAWIGAVPTSRRSGGGRLGSRPSPRPQRRPCRGCHSRCA